MGRGSVHDRSANTISRHHKIGLFADFVLGEGLIRIVPVSITSMLMDISTLKMKVLLVVQCL